MRDLGLGQLAGHLALSIIAAQHIRQEALVSLLADAHNNETAIRAVLQACKAHPDAAWWLLHQRSASVLASTHCRTVLAEEVNQVVIQLNSPSGSRVTQTAPRSESALTTSPRRAGAASRANPPSGGLTA
jgi:hypothetical protein